MKSEIQNSYQISDDNHTYRTEIPNILFQLGLSPFEFTLYCLLKKIAGDSGNCFYSVPKLAKMAQMSERQLQYAKLRLSQPFDLLNGRPLITIQKQKNAANNNLPDRITINKIWKANINFFEPDEVGGVVHHMHHPGAPYAPKEEPIKNNQKTSNPLPPLEGGAVCFSEQESEELQTHLAKIKGLSHQEMTEFIKLKAPFDKKLNAVRFVRVRQHKGEDIESAIGYLMWAVKEKNLLVEEKALMSLTAEEDIPKNAAFAANFVHDNIRIRQDSKSVDLMIFNNNHIVDKIELTLKLDHHLFKETMLRVVSELIAKRDAEIIDKKKRREEAEAMIAARKAQQSVSVESLSKIGVDDQLVHDR